jgi:hypothetical protein
MSHHETSNPELESCIQYCLDCHRQCQQDAMTHCLQMGGKHTEPEHFRLMMDCAEICRSAAVLMMNRSPFHNALCGLCSEICDECAQSCRTVDMEECARICERCADSCRRMATAGRQPPGSRDDLHQTQ